MAECITPKGTKLAKRCTSANTASVYGSWSLSALRTARPSRMLASSSACTFFWTSGYAHISKKAWTKKEFSPIFPSVKKRWWKTEKIPSRTQRRPVEVVSYPASIKSSAIYPSCLTMRKKKTRSGQISKKRLVWKVYQAYRRKNQIRHFWGKIYKRPSYRGRGVASMPPYAPAFSACSMTQFSSLNGRAPKRRLENTEKTAARYNCAEKRRSNQSINRSINQSSNQSSNPAINQSINRAINQSIKVFMDKLTYSAWHLWMMSGIKRRWTAAAPGIRDRGRHIVHPIQCWQWH